MAKYNVATVSYMDIINCIFGKSTPNGIKHGLTAQGNIMIFRKRKRNYVSNHIMKQPHEYERC